MSAACACTFRLKSLYSTVGSGEPPTSDNLLRVRSLDLGLDAQQRLLPRRSASGTGKVRQHLVEALAERAPTRIIALPPIVGPRVGRTVACQGTLQRPA